MYKNRKLLDKFAHDRITGGVPNPCPVCADCREVAGNKNWTYRDVRTWKLDVETKLKLESTVENPTAGELEKKLTVTSEYDAVFYLEQVPPSIIWRAMGGINALQEAVNRFRRVKESVSSGSLSERVLDSTKAFLGRRGSAVDVVSDGQPPLLWMSQDDGYVSANLRAVVNKLTEEYDCVDKPVEDIFTVTASETIPVSDIWSTAFATLSPTDNTIKCFWPDVEVAGQRNEMLHKCKNGQETLEPCLLPIIQRLREKLTQTDDGRKKLVRKQSLILAYHRSFRDISP